MQQVQGQGRQGKDKQQDDDERDVDADIGDTQDAVAEGVHHVQYGVGQGDRLPDARQQVYGIEHSPQVYQRGQDKGGYDGDVIEVVCKHAVEKSAQGKQDGGQDDDADDDKRTVNRRQADEEHGDDRHDQSYNQSPEHPA